MALNLNKDGENGGSKSNEPNKKGFNLNKDSVPEESASKGLNLSKGDTKPEESKLNLNKSSDEKPKTETTASKGLNLTKSPEGDTKPSLEKKPQSSGDSGAGSPAAVDKNKAKASGSGASNTSDSTKPKASDEKPKQQPAAPSNSANSAEKKKSKMLIPVLITALLGLGIFFFMSNRKDESIVVNPGPPQGPVTPTPPPTPTPPTPPTPPPAPEPIPNPGPTATPVYNPKVKTIATFAEGQSQANAAHASQLQAIKNHLSGNSSAKVVLTGYASSEGDENFNTSLSLKRAESLKKYIVSQGIDASKIITVAGGISNPIADNSTQEGRIKNRRVELELK